MAIVNDQPYSSPRFAVVQTVGVGRLQPTASTAANEYLFAFKAFTTFRLKGAQSFCFIKGKGNSSAITIFKINTATTSVGSIAIGTQSATLVDGSVTETNFIGGTDTLALANAIATETWISAPVLAIQEVYPG
jgi:hypothetical protein